MIERQVFVTWYTPEEKVPPEGETKVITFSGRSPNVIYDHAFGLAEWYDDGEGWDMSGIDADLTDFTIHAWADLEPYGAPKS